MFTVAFFWNLSWASWNKSASVSRRVFIPAECTLKQLCVSVCTHVTVLERLNGFIYQLVVVPCLIYAGQKLFVNTIIIILGYTKAGNFLAKWVSIHFHGRLSLESGALISWHIPFHAMHLVIIGYNLKICLSSQTPCTVARDGVGTRCYLLLYGN
jgi:hypothetical protein